MPPTTRLVQQPLPISVDEAVASVYASWSEDMLLTNVRNQAMASGYLCYHTRFSLKSSAGFPDLCLAGGPGDRLLFAELKREGKWPTEGRLSKGVVPRWVAGQREWLQRLEETGTEVYLWWPSDVADIGTILTRGARPEMACVQRLKEFLAR